MEQCGPVVPDSVWRSPLLALANAPLEGGLRHSAPARRTPARLSHVPGHVEGRRRLAAFTAAAFSPFGTLPEGSRRDAATAPPRPTPPDRSNLGVVGCTPPINQHDRLVTHHPRIVACL